LINQEGKCGFFSDSLLCNDNKDDDISDVEGCFEVQCNQVFIGMVTMQYQAQTDMVTGCAIC
jgi:hypothetical protein